MIVERLCNWSGTMQPRIDVTLVYAIECCQGQRTVGIVQVDILNFAGLDDGFFSIFHDRQEATFPDDGCGEIAFEKSDFLVIAILDIF